MSFKPEFIRIRLAKSDDFPEIGRLLAPDHMDDGEHTLRLVYSTSQPIFVVATDEANKIIGVDGVQKLQLTEGTVVFGLVKRIEPAYRRFGISHRLIEAYQQYPGIGNMAASAIKKTPRVRKFGTKVHYFGGTPSLDLVNNLFDYATADCNIDLINHDIDIDRLLAYDRTVFDYDRSRFLRAWCKRSGDKEPYARTVVAKQGQEIVGFGTLRLLGDSYSVQPLYANNDGVASGILKELFRLYTLQCDKKPLDINFFATNRLMIEFVRKAGFQSVLTAFRVYMDGTESSSKTAEAVEKYVKMERIYCTQFYWPA